jgi:hypothetical protein
MFLSILLAAAIAAPQSATPPEVADIAAGLDGLHAKHWPEASRLPTPSRAVSQQIDFSSPTSARCLQRLDTPTKRLCFWIGGLDLLATAMMVSLATSTMSTEAVVALAEQISQYKSDLGVLWDQHCSGGGGSGGGGAQEEWDKISVSWPTVLGPSPRGARTATDAPFVLPPMPARDGRDFRVPLLQMLRQLETALAVGGHPLGGGSRACAWAVAGATTAEAFGRAQASTPAIVGAGQVFAALRVQYCVGSARTQQEAAWTWLREHPRATQPLVIPLRTASGGPAPFERDPIIWVGVVAAVFAPELVPLFVLRQAAQ